MSSRFFVKKVWYLFVFSVESVITLSESAEHLVLKVSKVSGVTGWVFVVRVSEHEKTD